MMESVKSVLLRRARQGSGKGAEQEAPIGLYHRPPAGGRAERWAKLRTFGANIIGRAGDGGLAAATTTGAGFISSLVVSAFLQPLTDQLFVVVLALVDVILIIVGLRKLMTHAATRWFDGGSRWLDGWMLTLDLLFWIAFFSALTLVLKSVATLFATAPEHQVVAVLISFYLLLELLVLIFLHPSMTAFGSLDGLDGAMASD